MTPPKTGGAVLCGGRSRRFGRDKALVEVNGRPLAEYVGAVLEAAGCRPVVFVGGDGGRLRAATGRQVVADTWPGEGPLGGVVDALQWFSRRDVDGVVVAACDLSQLTVAAVDAVAGGGATAVAIAGRLHPALARWPVAASDELEALFSEGVRSLHEALDALGATEVVVEAAAMHNVNHASDLGISLCVVPISEIDVAALSERVAAGALVIDVREPDEYRAGHVPGAQLIPLATVGEHLDSFRSDGETYVICKSGGRSMRACEVAADEGYAVVNVTGGTSAWIDSGRDVVIGDHP